MLMSSDGPWHDDRGVVDQRAQAVLPGLVSDLRGGPPGRGPLHTGPASK